MKLEIVSGHSTYYIWYSPTSYRVFADAVKNELLTEKIASVTAKVVSSQSLYDRLCDRYRVVDLRSATSVYYSIDAEKADMTQNHIGFVVVFVFLLIAWLAFTAVLALVYGLIEVKNSYLRSYK